MSTKTDQLLNLATNLMQKDRLIRSLVKGLRKNRRLKAKFNSENQLLRQQLKALRHKNKSLEAGIKSLKLIAKSRRDALEKIAYLHEEYPGILPVSIALTQAESIALKALNWRNHK